MDYAIPSRGDQAGCTKEKLLLGAHDSLFMILASSGGTTIACTESLSRVKVVLVHDVDDIHELIAVHLLDRGCSMGRGSQSLRATVLRSHSDWDHLNRGCSMGHGALSGTRRT
eukprot:1150138-Pelagomonas_calceolata.AAC.12